MRKQTVRISEREFLYAVAGQLYDQAPNRQPRKAEIIMKTLRDIFRNQACNDNEFYTVRVEADNVYGWMHDILFSVPDFKELNLTQEEYELGISVDDEKRVEFRITTMHDVNDSESWKKDFVDLDAFVQNVYRKLLSARDLDEDCFLCIYQDSRSTYTLECGKADICKTCSINPHFANHYTPSREPRGKYTFSCKYDCFFNKYICCEECGQKEMCAYKCKDNSGNCGNAINRIEVK